MRGSCEGRQDVGSGFSVRLRGDRVAGRPDQSGSVINAGAKWEDAQVVVDEGVITSRNPGDLEVFSKKIIEEVREGRHTRRGAA